MNIVEFNETKSHKRGIGLIQNVVHALNVHVKRAEPTNTHQLTANLRIFKSLFNHIFVLTPLDIPGICFLFHDHNS